MKTQIPPSSIRVMVCLGFWAALCTACSAQSAPPIATVTVGWTYLYADQGLGERSNLNGWIARPAFTLDHGYAVFANFTNYYGSNHKGSINSHGFTFGASKQVFARPKLKPTVFAEAGDVRSSNAGSIVNQFAFASGASFSVPLKRWVSLAVTPAEWVLLFPKGQARNDFNAKIGVSFGFGHKR